MKLSTRGARLIEEFEGFSAKPYRDLAGVWTIGFGSTHGVGPGSPHVTRAQAEARLMREVDAEFGAAVNALKLPLSQSQFDALVSFVYNVGTGGVGRDTGVGRALRAHDWGRAAAHLLEWDRADGHVVGGLLRRRNAERALFLSRPSADPLAGYRPDEVKWIHDDDHHVGDAEARAERRAKMTARRKTIFAAARKTGWHVNNRAARYRSLRARTM